MAVGAALILGLTGCALDDLLLPLDSGEIPFETERPKPTDMGEVDDRPVTRQDGFLFDESDFEI